MSPEFDLWVLFIKKIRYIVHQKNMHENCKVFLIAELPEGDDLNFWNTASVFDQMYQQL